MAFLGPSGNPIFARTTTSGGFVFRPSVVLGYFLVELSRQWIGGGSQNEFIRFMSLGIGWLVYA